MIGNTIAIIFLWLVVSFVLGFLLSKIYVEDYTIEENDGVIWVTRNKRVNKVITIFFPHIALMYEVLCEKINGDGLAILIILILLLTLPMNILMCALALIYFICLKIWQHFCKVYAREDDDE